MKEENASLKSCELESEQAELQKDKNDFDSK
jgi:hypothetical protein